jgi:hypothetical protein
VAANCKLRLDEFTDLEVIRFSNYEMIKPQLLKLVVEVTRKQEFGVEVPNAYRDIDYHYFFIDYMTIIRQEIDRFISNNGCITQEDIDKILNKYDVSCILQKALCLTYNKFRDIYNSFLQIKGLCNELYIYEWVEGTCEQLPIQEMYIWGTESDCILNVPPYPFRLLEDFDYRLLETNDKRYLE